MTYTEYIRDYLERQVQNKPIYTSEIADSLAEYYGIERKKAAGATAVAVKRIMENGLMPDLRCYRKGIYYRTVETPFGETGISREKLIADRYLLPNNGYETGLNLLHDLGLTTQIPEERLFATNAAKDCTRFDKRLGVSVCPPKTTVNAENKAYLQALDALELMDKSPVDAKNPYKVIAEHIKRNGLSYETLLFYADRYYNKKTIIQLAHTAGINGLER